MSHILLIRNILLASGIFIAVIASTWHLTEAPAIWYDEGFYTQIAMNFAEYGEQRMQTAPNTFISTSYITVGYPLIAPLAASYTLFGIGTLQSRAVMVAFLLGFVAVSYFLIRALFGPWSATWSTLLLATFPMIYGNGKTVLGEVPGLFFLTTTLLSLSYLEKTNYRDWKGYAAVGLCAGLCAATKPFFILLLIALFLTLLIKWKYIELNWYGAFAGLVALLVPLCAWVWLQFGADASLSSILTDYANPYTVQNLPAHMATNALRFVTESTPLFTLILMSIWIAALFLRKKQRVHISSAEIAALLFCILAIMSYLRLEGWYRYLFPATTIALIFLPSSLFVLFEFFKRKLAILQGREWLIPAAIVLLCASQLYQTAFSSYVAQYYGGTRTRNTSLVLSKLDPTKTVFLYNTPELVIFLPSKNYYQFLSPIPKVHMGEENLPLLRNGVPDIVLVEGETYKKEEVLFSTYKVTQEVDRYLVLQK